MNIESNRQLFERLVDQWQIECGVASSISHITNCPPYLAIFEMGEDALPLIFEDMRQNGPDRWFVALEALTCHDPIPVETYGNMRKMTDVWLDYQSHFLD